MISELGSAPENAGKSMRRMRNETYRQKTDMPVLSGQVWYDQKMGRGLSRGSYVHIADDSESCRSSSRRLGTGIRNGYDAGGLLMSDLFLMTCVECGKKYEPHTWKQRICSGECIKKRRQRLERKS